MSTISFGHHGLEVKTMEQKNVMSPVLQPLPYITIICLFLIYKEQYLYSFILFSVFIISIILFYFYHSKRNPELLQSEKCRIEMQKISIAQEAKNDNEEINSPVLVAPQETTLISLKNDKEEKL